MSRVRPSTRPLRFRRGKTGSRRGLGTVEVVIVIAVLIGIALLFRSAITAYARDIIESVFGDSSVVTDGLDGSESGG